MTQVMIALRMYLILSFIEFQSKVDQSLQQMIRFIQRKYLAITNTNESQYNASSTFSELSGTDVDSESQEINLERDSVETNRVELDKPIEFNESD